MSDPYQAVIFNPSLLPIGRRQHEDGDDAALVAQRQALDDVHRGAELAGGRQLARRHEGMRREVLGHQADDQATHAAHGGANEGLTQVEPAFRIIVEPYMIRQLSS